MLTILHGLMLVRDTTCAVDTVITGSIYFCQRAILRFAPQRLHTAPIGADIWRGGVDSSTPNRYRGPQMEDFNKFLPKFEI